MVWHPLVVALLFGMFYGLFPHTAMAAPVAPTTAAQEFMAQGWNAWQRGAFEEAVRSWQDAAQRYAQAGQPRAQSVALTQLARAYQALGQYRKAGQSLSSALELARKSGDRVQVATVLGSLGGTYFVSGSLDAAQQALQEGLRLAREIGNTALMATLLNDLGNVFTSQNKYAEALDAYGESVRVTEQHDRALAVRALTNAAMASMQQGQHQTARTRLDMAWAQMQNVPPSHDKAYSFINIGLAYASLSASLSEDETQLTLRAAALPDRAQYEPLLVEARDAVELFKAVELRDYFKDDCVDAARQRVVNLESVAQSAITIYPILLPERTELLLSLPDGLRRVTVPVTAERLTQEVRELRRLLEKVTTREYLPHAQQLYDWLIRPLAPALASTPIDTLVFVPDGPLRTIPMAALHDGQQFLIQKYAIATTPGLKLTDPRPLPRGNTQMLALGLTEAIQGFSALPYVSSEMATLQQLYGAEVLLNQRFLLPSVDKELQEKPFSIVHIASHGQFDSDVQKTFVLTFDDKLTMDHLEQTVGRLRFRENALELLTLSACQTAAGDDQAALGLAGVAIKAGARSALATLWFIDDEASSELITEFYRQLQDPAISRAKALQRAQGKLLSNWRYEHPGYWAPFLLLNNWL